jgi:hypothetical protein
MNKIKLSKSVFVNKDKTQFGVDFYEQICDECFRLLKNYINPRCNNGNVLEQMEKFSIESAANNLGHFVKSYFKANEIDFQTINCRANKKIEVTISKVEILKADSSFQNCEFVIHFISKDLCYIAFAGNSVIVSPLIDGIYTIMVDFDDKEVSVEYLLNN